MGGNRMTILERINEDMKAAMKAKDEGKERLSTIRMAKAALKNAEIDKRRPLTDDEVIEVLAREVKQRRDAIAEYGAGAGAEYVQKLEGEIAVLMDYLPQQLTEAEVRALVQEAVQATGAASVKEMGKVMGVLMPKVKGRADGKLVNQIVKEVLG